MALADDGLGIWRNLINSIPDDEDGSELIPVLTGVEDESYTLYDTTGNEAEPYPMTVNALITDCGGRLLLQLQVAFNAFSGLKESLDHCKICRKCRQKLHFLQANARHDIDKGIQSIWAKIYQDNQSVQDEPKTVRRSKLGEIVESLEDKTVKEQDQIFTEAKKDPELKKKLLWLKNILDINLK